MRPTMLPLSQTATAFKRHLKLTGLVVSLLVSRQLPLVGQR